MTVIVFKRKIAIWKQPKRRLVNFWNSLFQFFLLTRRRRVLKLYVKFLFVFSVLLLLQSFSAPLITLTPSLFFIFFYEYLSFNFPFFFIKPWLKEEYSLLKTRICYEIQSNPALHVTTLSITWFKICNFSFSFYFSLVTVCHARTVFWNFIPNVTNNIGCTIAEVLSQSSS